MSRERYRLSWKRLEGSGRRLGGNRGHFGELIRRRWPTVETVENLDKLPVRAAKGIPVRRIGSNRSAIYRTPIVTEYAVNDSRLACDAFGGRVNMRGHGRQIVVTEPTMKIFRAGNLPVFGQLIDPLISIITLSFVLEPIDTRADLFDKVVQLRCVSLFTV